MGPALDKFISRHFTPKGINPSTNKDHIHIKKIYKNLNITNDFSTTKFLEIQLMSNFFPKEIILITQQIKKIYRVNNNHIFILLQVILCHKFFPHSFKKEYLLSVCHWLDEEAKENYLKFLKKKEKKIQNKKIDQKAFYLLSEWDKQLKQEHLINNFMKNYPFILSMEGEIEKRLQQQPLFILTDKHILSSGDWRFKNRLKKWVENKININFPLTHSLKENSKITTIENKTLSEEQSKAIKNSLSNPLTIITGGPGTGKTTIIKIILNYFLNKSDVKKEKKKVALVAPTGKAVNRMRESLSQINDLPFLKIHSSTIHQVLGLNQNRNRPVFDSNKPLNYDMIILDECSMVNLKLMVWLMEATLPTCQLILIGDIKQLPAIDGSFPFYQIVSLVKDKQKIHTHLVKTHRFNSQINALVKKIEKGKVEEIFQLNHSNIKIIEPNSITTPKELIKQFFSKIVTKKFSLSSHNLSKKNDYIEEIFASLSNFVFLTSSKMGFWGSFYLNFLFSQHLSGKRYYSGQPIMILENNYDCELFNGDRGMIVSVTDKNLEDNLCAVFKQNKKDEPPYRFFSTQQLPKHETSYAMTIHKSQGSEFKEIVLCLGEMGRLQLSRELLYTGVTRAKEKITLIASEKTMQKAVGYSINADFLPPYSPNLNFLERL